MHDKIKQLGHWVGFIGGLVAILATFGGGVVAVDGKASASALTLDEQRITVLETRYSDIDSRLDRIENKLDRALERSADRANTPQAPVGRKN